MNVILADVLGYCMGVRRAVDSALDALEKYKDKNVYSLGPIIHNQTALDFLSSKGLKILKEDELQKAENKSVVIIRAHGVPPSVIEELQKKDCIIINATCPRVVASQKNAQRYAAMDYTIVLAGDKNHGEVTGIAGYAGDKFILVENSNEVSNLKIPSDEKVILLSQTTYSPVEFNKIANIIEEKYQNSKIMNTICPATKERQDALIKLCPIVDGIVVVGGKNSANTKRLLQTALKYCKNAILIERAEEIPSEFLSLNTVGITAGASTPDSVIQEVKSYLENKIA